MASELGRGEGDRHGGGTEMPTHRGIARPEGGGLVGL